MYQRDLFRILFSDRRRELCELGLQE